MIFITVIIVDRKGSQELSRDLYRSALEDVEAMNYSIVTRDPQHFKGNFKTIKLGKLKREGIDSADVRDELLGFANLSPWSRFRPDFIHGLGPANRLNINWNIMV